MTECYMRADDRQSSKTIERRTIGVRPLVKPLATRQNQRMQNSSVIAPEVR